MLKFYEGVAEIFEVDVDTISPGFPLHTDDVTWDSLAIVSMIALVDECYDVMLDGTELTECQSVADVEKLIGQAGMAAQ